VRHLVAGQDPADGGGDQAEFAGQIHRATMLALAQRQNLGFHRGVDAVGGGVRA
jgi:hypothetical protein